MTEKRQATAANEDMAEQRDETRTNNTDERQNTAPDHVSEEQERAGIDSLNAINSDDMVNALEAAQANERELSDKLLRVQADLENLRRRGEREVAAAHRYALEGFAKELVNVRDSLELGAEAARASVDIEKLREGVDLTLRQLSSVFEKFGVKEVNPVKQKFDPTFHQAMSVQEAADLDPNTVIAVFQKGYLLHDRLLRPALVQVSKAAAAPLSSKTAPPPPDGQSEQ